MAQRARYTILSMMKDEGPAVLEWVAYHRHIGFDNICVYTNNCSDGTDALLMRLEELGEVRHFRNDVPKGKKPQPHALALAGRNRAVTTSDWILTMDADEFVSIKVGRGWVQNLVERLPDGTDAIAITWRFFGSSDQTEWNPGLVTEAYTHAAPDDFRKGWGVKTMFRPFENMKFGIHRPSVHKARQHPERAQALLDQRWVNGSGKPMPEDFPLSGWRSTKPTLGYKWVEMNHYAVKSYEAYLLRRLRGNVNNKEDKYNANYFALFDRNEIEAPNAQRHLPAVKRRIAGYLEDPQVARLHKAALAFHAKRVERLRGTPHYEGWLAGLRSAHNVPYGRLNEVLFTQHLPKEWQTKIAEMRAQGVPDRTLALMIAGSQTATKRETRAELRKAAEQADTPPEGEG
ncbi:MAG: glycosyltransferase family 2 protein [Pseudomonadota bacterium]